ncbi:MAG TPA: TetR/AcrR family transcriptional regulator [Rhodospirillales bacterium]|nr:TetR/AcrR family transcriptional regulator [Rhodospirillales bacterium]
MSRKREILRRAAEIFERKGVSDTSIEDIAKAVGIKREGIYYYFKSRNDILLEVILPQSITLHRSLERICDSRMDSGEKLHGAIQNHLDAFNPAYLEMSVALRESQSTINDTRFSEIRRTWDSYSELWTRLVTEGQETGEFRADMDPKMIAFGLLGMCNWVSRWYDPDKSVSISEIVETYFSLATTGLKTEPVA